MRSCIQGREQGRAVRFLLTAISLTEDLNNNSSGVPCLTRHCFSIVMSMQVTIPTNKSFVGVFFCTASRNVDVYINFPRMNLISLNTSPSSCAVYEL